MWIGLVDGALFWSGTVRINEQINLALTDTVFLLSVGFCANASGVLYRLCGVWTERGEGRSWKSGGILVVVLIEGCSCVRTSSMVERRPVME